MSNSPLEMFPAIFNKIFVLEEEKRLADRDKFEKFVSLVSYPRIDWLSQQIQTGSLRSEMFDLYEDVYAFYDSPERDFYNPKLQRRSKAFEKTFRELDEFTISTWVENPRNPLIFMIQPGYVDGDHARADRELETGTELVLRMGRTYIAF